MKDFTINDYLELINYEVQEGTKILWKYYGENAYSYSWAKHGALAYIQECNVVFDTKTQLVYECTFFDSTDGKDHEHNWCHPEFKYFKDLVDKEREELQLSLLPEDFDNPAKFTFSYDDECEFLTTVYNLIKEAK